MFYINFRTMLEKPTKQTMKRCIYAYKALVCQRQKKNARCVEKYLFFLRIQITSYIKGRSRKHIGIYLNAIHKYHQNICMQLKFNNHFRCIPVYYHKNHFNNTNHSNYFILKILLNIPHIYFVL